MEARLASLNLSHYASALREHEIDDDCLKLMTAAAASAASRASSGLRPAHRPSSRLRPRGAARAQSRRLRHHATSTITHGVGAGRPAAGAGTADPPAAQEAARAREHEGSY